MSNVMSDSYLGLAKLTKYVRKTCASPARSAAPSPRSATTSTTTTRRDVCGSVRSITRRPTASLASLRHWIGWPTSGPPRGGLTPSGGRLPDRGPKAQAARWSDSGSLVEDFLISSSHHLCQLVRQHLRLQNFACLERLGKTLNGRPHVRQCLWITLG
jgi:hypothetical protein